MRHAARQLIPLLVSAVGGVLCTIVIAVFVVVYSPQPTRWMSAYEHTANAVHIHKSLASERFLTIESSDSERDVVSLASGFGYKSLDIRYYDPIGNLVFGPREPLRIKRRAFLTELGWPNAAFATNARSIGLRFSAELAPNSPSDDQTLHDGRQTTVHVLWAGLCLNSLLVATLLLTPWVLFRRRATFCYVSRPVVAAVCMGLWLSILTAWGCDLAHQFVTFLPRDHDVYLDPAAFDASVRSIDIPSSTEWDQFYGSVTSSIGFHASMIDFKTGPDKRMSAHKCWLSLGWPVHCLKGSQIGPWRAVSDPWPEEMKLHHAVVLMAMPVWWPGMLINWLFYALVIIVGMRGPGALRRFYRRRRHRCLMCGYPVGEASRCSECGQLHRG